MWYDDEEDIDGSKLSFRDSRHLKKLTLPADVHLPNKNEAKLLRKLMSETGMNEEEIRQVKKYRQMLATASKKQGTKSEMDRKLLAVLKEITRELKLPKTHPKVLERFQAKLNDIKDGKDRDNYWKFRSLHLMLHSTNDIMQRLGLV